MNWTAESNPKKGISYYDHVISETPLGRCIIEWKSWKEYQDFDITLNNEWIGVEGDLEAAKERAKEYLTNKMNELKFFLK